MSWDWSGGQAVLLLPHLGVAQLIGADGAGARAAGPLDATGRAIERRRPAQGFTAGVGEKGGSSMLVAHFSRALARLIAQYKYRCVQERECSSHSLPPF
ncbi:hypothetical protein PVAP13_4NG218420 [Panicum virgatum]|uniref:Secreted protein n=1 Tax=Panicum virgatum TaxID=38727 RepID=A0A8T0T3J6_PANVG|nr:hypothetical protein PVAP13_4NG218420 [Panicum virgatum]